MQQQTDVKEIVIRVTNVNNWQRGIVEVVSDEGAEFIHLMCACEYLIRLVAIRSGVEYDEACRQLVEGSKTYNEQIPFEIIKGKSY